jgi:hypothetical protein
MRGRDPSTGLPVGDAVTHAEPVGRVTSAGVPPCIPTVDLGDQGQEVALRAADTSVRGIDGSDQVGTRTAVCQLEHVFEPIELARRGL